jgi:hypothetical protein
MLWSALWRASMWCILSLTITCKQLTYVNSQVSELGRRSFGVRCIFNHRQQPEWTSWGTLSQRHLSYAWILDLEKLQNNKFCWFILLHFRVPCNAATDN